MRSSYCYPVIILSIFSHLEVTSSTQDVCANRTFYEVTLNNENITVFQLEGEQLVITATNTISQATVQPMHYQPTPYKWNTTFALILPEDIGNTTRTTDSPYIISTMNKTYDKAVVKYIRYQHLRQHNKTVNQSIVISATLCLGIPPKITKVQVNWVENKKYFLEICCSVSGTPSPKVQIYRSVGDKQERHIILPPTDTNASLNCFPLRIPIEPLAEDYTASLIISAENCFATDHTEVWIRDLQHGSTITDSQFLTSSEFQKWASALVSISVVCLFLIMAIVVIWFVRRYYQVKDTSEDYVPKYQTLQVLSL
jgi:hypothetical protein